MDYSKRLKQSASKRRKANARFKYREDGLKLKKLGGGMPKLERQIKGHTWTKQKKKYLNWNKTDTSIIQFQVARGKTTINDY